ncbi:ferritin family protein [Streptomyces corynorhini]|uniref:VlmB-like protein n=1 Tax=Streptomyces corynorhini TaxID=2282652 RepID=A0A370B8F8_9ACTN|nr:VlmB-like protein [Streptomyces corynorhini]RDG38090.1 VlmB-like protein [Streptomyces corynorhini]
MESEIRPEVDWDRTVPVLEGARSLELTPESCDLQYWLDEVAGRLLRRIPTGHTPGADIPEQVLKPGPLRDALIEEFAFRSIAEEKVTRALGYLVSLAPTRVLTEFFSTQLLDEARHARVFREHLVEIGVPAAEVDDTITTVAGKAIESVLDPLEEFGLSVIRDERDFYGGVITLTVLVEGVLAPFGELSERKWAPLNPAAAEIERGAGMDEIRHLSVGSSVIQRHLQEEPGEKGRILELIQRGRGLWEGLPMQPVLFQRESLFQQGLAEWGHLVSDYEVWPGRKLVDTSAEERMVTASTWSQETQDVRMRYMGLI